MEASEDILGNLVNGNRLATGVASPEAHPFLLPSGSCGSGGVHKSYTLRSIALDPGEGLTAYWLSEKTKTTKDVVTVLLCPYDRETPASHMNRATPSTPDRDLVGLLA